MIFPGPVIFTGCKLVVYYSYCMHDIHNQHGNISSHDYHHSDYINYDYDYDNGISNK